MKMLDVLAHLSKGGRVIHQYSRRGNHWQADGKACYTKCTTPVYALIARGLAAEDRGSRELYLTTAGRWYYALNRPK